MQVMTAWSLVLTLVLSTYSNFLAISLERKLPLRPFARTVRELGEKVASGKHRLVAMVGLDLTLHISHSQ